MISWKKDIDTAMPESSSRSRSELVDNPPLQAWNNRGRRPSGFPQGRGRVGRLRLSEDLLGGKS